MCFYFLSKLEGEDRVGRFTPDLKMAEAWERMMNSAGEILSDDEILLNHEYLESKIEKLCKTTYDKAHVLTEGTGRKWRPKK